MHVSRRYPTRLVLAVAIAATVLVIGAAAAFGQGAPPSDQPVGGDGVIRRIRATTVVITARCRRVVRASGSPLPRGVAARRAAVPGLTTVGQATIDGHDPAARDVAIAAAVKDATAQANAAADAAGIQLGAIIDMQVSVMPYYAYPMMGAASGSSPGSTGGGRRHGARSGAGRLPRLRERHGHLGAELTPTARSAHVGDRRPDRARDPRRREDVPPLVHGAARDPTLRAPRAPGTSRSLTRPPSAGPSVTGPNSALTRNRSRSMAAPSAAFASGSVVGRFAVRRRHERFRRGAQVGARLGNRRQLHVLELRHAPEDPS